MESEFDRKVLSLLEKDPRFAREAYSFVSEAVTYSVSKLAHKRHVSAAELLDGIREFAVQKFGAVAVNVLSNWGIYLEDDVGTVVYLLIGIGILSASEDDSPEDFCTGRELIPSLPQIRSVRRKSDKLPFID